MFSKFFIVLHELELLSLRKIFLLDCFHVLIQSAFRFSDLVGALSFCHSKIEESKRE